MLTFGPEESLLPVQGWQCEQWGHFGAGEKELLFLMSLVAGCWCCAAEKLDQQRACCISTKHLKD